jgi:hypothetical protein
MEEGHEIKSVLPVEDGYTNMNSFFSGMTFTFRDIGSGQYQFKVINSTSFTYSLQ